MPASQPDNPYEPYYSAPEVSRGSSIWSESPENVEVALRRLAGSLAPQVSDKDGKLDAKAYMAGIPPWKNSPWRP